MYYIVGIFIIFRTSRTTMMLNYNRNSQWCSIFACPAHPYTLIESRTPFWYKSKLVNIKFMFLYRNTLVFVGEKKCFYMFLKDYVSFCIHFPIWISHVHCTYSNHLIWMRHFAFIVFMLDARSCKNNMCSCQMIKSDVYRVQCSTYQKIIQI